LQDRTDADKDRITLEMQNKTLQEQLTKQDEQNQHDRNLERKEFED
jgi:uncharacterized membrane protein